MLENINLYFTSPAFWINTIVWLCTLALVIAVIIDFVFYEEKDETKNKQKSQVATWRMAIFFVLVYLAIRFRIWIYSIQNLQIYLIIIWIIITIISTVFNIVWRFYLSTNWANNIKIYKDHKLINTWPYKIVRHPLYASLIWINYWLWLIYSNWLVFVLATCIFIPMMIYRAKQEEKLLEKNFWEYKDYKKKVWMFFPKIKKLW